jgi:PhnB protein
MAIQADHWKAHFPWRTLGANFSVRPAPMMSLQRSQQTKTMDTSYIPNGYHAVVAAINMPGAAAAMEWYKKVFNAIEKMRLTEPDGRIAHGEINIDGTSIMLAEENPDYNRSPKTLNGTSVVFSIYVPDADATIQKAVDAGAKLIEAAADQFYGDRSGRIEDPFGYKWRVSTHIKEVSEAEMQKMLDDMMKA